MPSRCPESQDFPDKIGHEPVLKNESVALLAPKDGGAYIDCTFGGGGHSRAILESANCTLTAFDKDRDAAIRAREFAKDFPGRFQFIGEPFSKLNELKTSGYVGILMDLGVSSFQLDEADRGFSLRKEGPIDMRMDVSHGITALELIERTPLFELEEIIRDYGEEPRYRKVAKALKDAAQNGELKTTIDLANLVGAQSALKNPSRNFDIPSLANCGKRRASRNRKSPARRIQLAFLRRSFGGHIVPLA
mgnify:CR=1 FL=1